MRKNGLNLRLAFTLVELIVVITILAILWTIAFISLQWYSRDARDSVRKTDLASISKQLELMLVKAWKVYIPENKVDITASGTIISYQWEMWQNTLNKLWVNNWWLDPVGQTSYIYTTTKNLKQYELMWFLENWNTAYISTFPQSYAASDLKNRFPVVKWNNIWIFLDPVTKEPVNNTGTWIDIIKTTTNYTAYVDNSSNWSITWTGKILFTSIYNWNKDFLKDKALAKLDSSLVLYMDMETTIQTWWLLMMKDLSMYQNDWKCDYNWTPFDCWSSSWPKFVNSNWRKAMNFTNSWWKSDFIQSKDWPSLDISTNEVTISVWYKLDKDLSQMYYNWPNLIAKRPNHIGWYMAHFNKSNSSISMSYSFLWWFGYNTLSTQKSSFFIKPDKWYFYTWIKSKKWIYQYIDWILISYIDSLSLMDRSPSVNLIIWQYLEWDLDDIRVYNRALSDSEVKALYESSK